MSDLAIQPTPSKSLRHVITASGYRPFFTQKGLDKDLDDQADEKRPGSNFDLFQNCLAQWLRAIRDDCGADWSNLIESAWHRHSNLLRSLARNTDTTGMIAEPAQHAFFRLFVVPELSGMIRRASHEVSLLDLNQWWVAPFATWLQAAALQTMLPVRQLLEQLANHLNIDERTLERWQHGGPIKKPMWPYRSTTQAMFHGSELVAKKSEHLTGWLAMVVALQSLPADLRDVIKRDFHLHGQRPLQNEQQFISQLKREAADRNSLPVSDEAARVLADLDRLFADARGNEQPIRDRLNWLRALCERSNPSLRATHEYLCSWLCARLDANLGEKDNALKLYRAACHSAWWRAGPNQHGILHEALCYAVGVGDKVQANHYWDKCFLLGLNKPPKRELDEQKMQHLSTEFERLFTEQKAKKRVPPAMRVVVLNKPFSLSAKELANPNRISAQSDGQVRYTALMNAVLLGTLEDVKQAVQAGADPNLIIPESGENALIMALRRAYDRKDPDILKYLLTLRISTETANYPASSDRETPLQIAMNMGDAEVVDKLITLGADVEQSCFTSPCALVYAMALLHDSMHVSDPAQRDAYLDGRVPADAFDAKAGAVLDCELPARRQAWMSDFEAPRKHLIYEAVTSYYRRPVNARRQVVMILLENKADPNRRYEDFNGYQDLWTPTLFAAQIGNLDVLKAMIKADGNPWLSLDNESPLNVKDALWVAAVYKRHAVVEYLQMQLPRRPAC
ncbi:ankyrin repeat domain-containing protein [Pseudomonas sp. BF-B-30]|uniref:ankyrin repeat domain-containing protein n=1 Tax=Pseudomonas sp. BF-B-30 TaxID=2832388 RepID=UPI001CBD704B|nr:ankyrin repeat domain-containing protein [Pseudomonas sp. BF-B-30]